MDDVISAGVSSLVKFSEAGVVILFFHVCKACLGISIKVFRSLVSVYLIASEPFIESHGAHDIVIGHGVETVKSGLDFLLGSDSCLEASGAPSGTVSLPIHDIFLVETPGFEYQSINIVGFNKLIL